MVGIDLLPIEPMPGVEFIALDFLDEAAPERLIEALGGPADVVMSDMAANATGHRQTDHLRIVGLAEAAADFARAVLEPGGAFLAKVLQGGTEAALLADLKRDFATVRHVKPAASRADSAELYVLATGFRGENSRLPSRPVILGRRASADPRTPLRRGSRMGKRANAPGVLGSRLSARPRMTSASRAAVQLRPASDPRCLRKNAIVRPQARSAASLL